MGNCTLDQSQVNLRITGVKYFWAVTILTAIAQRCKKFYIPDISVAVIAWFLCLPKNVGAAVDVSFHYQNTLSVAAERANSTTQQIHISLYTSVNARGHANSRQSVLIYNNWSFRVFKVSIIIRAEFVTKNDESKNYNRVTLLRHPSVYCIEETLMYRAVDRLICNKLHKSIQL